MNITDVKARNTIIKQAVRPTTPKTVKPPAIPNGFKIAAKKASPVNSGIKFLTNLTHPKNEEEDAICRLFKVSDQMLAKLRGLANQRHLTYAKFAAIISSSKDREIIPLKTLQTQIVTLTRGIITKFQPAIIKQSKPIQEIIRKRAQIFEGGHWRAILNIANQPQNGRIKEIFKKYNIRSYNQLLKLNFKGMTLDEENVLKQILANANAAHYLTLQETHDSKFLERYQNHLTNLYIASHLIKINRRDLARLIVAAHRLHALSDYVQGRLDQFDRGAKIALRDFPEKEILQNYIDAARIALLDHSRFKQMNAFAETPEEQRTRARLIQFTLQYIVRTKAGFPSDDQRAIRNRLIRKAIEALQVLGVNHRTFDIEIAFTNPHLDAGDELILRTLYSDIVTGKSISINRKGLPNFLTLTFDELQKRATKEMFNAIHQYSILIDGSVGKAKNLRLNAYYNALKTVGVQYSDLAIIGSTCALERITKEDKAWLNKIKDLPISQIKQEIQKRISNLELQYSKVDTTKKQILIQRLRKLIYISAPLYSTEKSYYASVIPNATLFQKDVISTMNIFESSNNKYSEFESRRLFSDLREEIGNSGVLNQLAQNYIATRNENGEEIDREYLESIVKRSPIANFRFDNPLVQDAMIKIIDALYHKFLDDMKDKGANYPKAKMETKAAIERIFRQIKADMNRLDHLNSHKLFQLIQLANEVSNSAVQYGVFTEAEIDGLRDANMHNRPDRGLTLANMVKGKGLYRTRGYNALPLEVREAIERAGFKKFVSVNLHLLNVTWVPIKYGLNTGVALGYSAKEMFVGYMRGTRPEDHYKVALVLVHELRHIVDLERIKNRMGDPNYQILSSSLALERNACRDEYLFIKAYYDKVKGENKNDPRLAKIKRLFQWSTRRLEVANIALGLNKNDTSYDFTPTFDHSFAPTYLHPGLVQSVRRHRLITNISNHPYFKSMTGIGRGLTLSYALTYIQDVLSSKIFEDNMPKGLGRQIFQRLLDLRYIDQNGVVTGRIVQKFEDFEKTFKLENTPHKKKITIETYNLLVKIQRRNLPYYDPNRRYHFIEFVRSVLKSKFPKKSDADIEKDVQSTIKDRQKAVALFVNLK